MKDNMSGFIYILTNPSFPEYVKIGYADNVEQRVKQLNRTECTPFAFRIYATYAVNVRLTDMKLHNMIDKINPELRAIDNPDGKKRVREFYAMSAEDAFSLFEAMSEIHGTTENLCSYKLNESDMQQEIEANEIKTQAQERKSNFSFADLSIPIGAELTFVNDCTKKVIVYNNRNKVRYNDKITTLSPLAQELLGKKSPVQGPLYFLYEGETLVQRRERANTDKSVPYIPGR